MQGNLDIDVVNLAKAIRQHESGNKAQLPGEGAELGGKSLYQYTHGTWKSVAGKYLRDQNAQLTRENENKATYLRIADWKKQGYNPAQIASMWNAGEGRPNAYKENWRGVNKYGVKFDTPAYVAKVYNTYKQEKAKTTPPQPTQQPQLAQPAQPQVPAQKKSFFDKFADTSGKVLSAGANMLGIPALIENIASIGEAGAYGVNKLLGREQQAQWILDNPISAPQKMAATQGTAAGIKNVVGNTIEAGLGASVLATGGLGAAAKGTQVATKAPGFFKTIGTGAKLGAGYGAGFGVAEGLKQNLDTPRIIGEGLKSGVTGGILGGGLGLAGYGLSKVAGKVATSAAAKKAGISTKEMGNIAKVEEELYNIENNYAKLRKVNQFEKDAGAASRRRIAESNVLAGSIDENGRIITKSIDGPIERYKNATIGEYENLVGKILEKEGARVSPAFVAKKLEETLMRSGLEGNALKTALGRIESEVQGLMLRADQNGLIPLSSVHYAKIATTKGINYATEPFVAAERKAIAKAYKELVEEVSKENIKPINKEIQKYLKDIKLLENLDGKIVRGGKLGKYFSQIAGNLSGAAVGGAIGGPLGMVSGTVAGGEIASRIKGKTIQGILGRGQFKAPKKSEVLQKALNEAETRVKVTQKGGKQRVPVEVMPEDRPGRLLPPPRPKVNVLPKGNVIQVGAPKSAGEKTKESIGILAKRLKESNVKQEVVESLPIKKLLDPEDLMGVDELSYNIPKTDKSFSKGPIDVVKLKDEYIILDGRHRAVEAFRKGEKDISVNVLTEKEALKKYTGDWPQLEEIFKPLPKGNGEILKSTEYKSALEALRSPEMKAKLKAVEAKMPKKVTKTSNNLYHSTSAENLDSIVKGGLKTGQKPKFEGVSSPNKISFSANEEAAKYYGGDVMIRTKTSYKPTDLELDLLAGGEGTYVTGKNIPPEMLEIKVGNKWIPLTEYKQGILRAGKADNTNPKGILSNVKSAGAEPKGGQKYYSGRNGDMATAENTGMYGNGAYLTSDVKRAKLYGETIDEFSVEGLKLYEPKDTIKELFGRDTNYGDSALITKKYKDLGYDGLKIGGGKDKEIVVFDPKKLNKQPTTPKQGILPKALKDKPGFIGQDNTSQLLQEAKKYKSAEEFTDFGIIMRKDPIVNGKAVGKDFGELESLVSYRKTSEFLGYGEYKFNEGVLKGKIGAGQKLIKGKVNHWKERISKGERPIVIIEDEPYISKMIDATGRRYDAILENRVRQGHSRLEAYKQLGIKKVPVVYKSQLTDIWNKAQKLKPNPLIQEARKYKSSKEFIEALDINYRDSWKGNKDKDADRLLALFDGKVFHGTNAADEIIKKGYKKGNYFNSGAYFSDMPDEAIGYMKQGRSSGGKSSSVLVNDLSNLKIKMQEGTDGDIIRKINKLEPGIEEYVLKLKKQGYDGIKSRWGETLVWNTQKIKTPEKLEEIWNKANNSNNKPGYIGSDFARNKEGQRFGKTGAGMLIKGAAAMVTVATAAPLVSNALKVKTPQQEQLEVVKEKMESTKESEKPKTKDEEIEDYVKNIKVTINKKGKNLGNTLAEDNNNPGNLYFANQPNATKNGKFAQFPTPELGFRALIKDVQAKQKKGLTLEEMMNIYAPPEENDTDAYLDALEGWLNVKREDKASGIDPIELAKRIAQFESQTVVE